MYHDMVGDHETERPAQGGSVILRLGSTGRKSAQAFHALRRTMEPSSTPGRMTTHVAASTSPTRLGEVLLLHQYEDSTAFERDRQGLGTFFGVFVPCTCTIFGVVVFLRLGFVVGEAGIWCTLIICFVSFLICLLTTLSLCTLIGEGGDGALMNAGVPRVAADPGIYCALRKAVGPDLGAALGFAFFLAFTVNAAFYITGFAVMLSNSLHALRSTVQVFPWNPPGTWVDVVAASAVLLLLTLICHKGVAFSARASFGTLVAILVCICAAIICVLTPTTAPIPTGFSAQTFRANCPPQLSKFTGSGGDGGDSMMLMFVLVFPGFTGMLAGSNLSANLAKPTTSIARGTLSSLAFVLVTYALIVLAVGGSIHRETLRSNLFLLNDVTYKTMRLPLGHVGICLTTTSSALSYLLGAPRILQAVARDAGWSFFSRGTPAQLSACGRAPARRWNEPAQDADSQLGRVGEPHLELFCTWLVAQLILLTGTVNLLAPLITGLFLLSFCLINLFAFLSCLSRAPGERRYFQFSSRWLALLGFLLSFLAMAAALASSIAVCISLVALLVSLLVWRRHALVSLVGSRRAAAIATTAFTSSLTSEGVTVEERIERAAAYVHDALAGRFRGVHWAVGAQSRIYAQRLLRSLRYVRAVNLCVYLAIALIERPSWCYHTRSCGEPHQVMVSGLPVISTGASQAIEGLCIALFAAEMTLKAYCMSARSFFLSPWHVMQMLLLVVSSGVLVVRAVQPANPTLLDQPQAAALNYLNPLLRPLLFVSLSRSVRRSLRSFVRVLPAVIDMFFVLFLLLVFSAVLAVLLFGTMPKEEHTFATFGSSILSLFILLTQANFPDVMLPIYEKHRAAAFFFIAFLIVSVFILMNLVLVTVIRTYESHMRSAEALARCRRDLAIQAAFTLLDLNANGFVDLIEFSSLLQRVGTPVFSLFDGQMNRALDTVHTMHALQRMLEGDAALPVRGLGPEAFAECVLALQKNDNKLMGSALDDDDDEQDEGDAAQVHDTIVESSELSPMSSPVDEGRHQSQRAHMPTVEDSVLVARSGSGAAPENADEGRGVGCGQTECSCSSSPAGSASATALSNREGGNDSGNNDGLTLNDRRPSATDMGSVCGSLSAGLAPLAHIVSAHGSVGETMSAGGGISTSVRHLERRQIAVVHSSDGTTATIGATHTLMASTRSARIARFLRKVLNSARCRLLIDATVVLNVVVIATEVELMGRQEWAALEGIEGTAPIFDLVFLMEVCLKLWSFGSVRFWKRRADTYAFVVVVITCLFDVAWLSLLLDDVSKRKSMHKTSSTLMRVALGLRVLRLPRLVFSLQRSNAIFRLLLRALPSFFGLLGLICVLFSLYAQLGVAFFGGKIRKDQWPAMSNSEGIPPGYAFCNFNDFPSALLTLFSLLMVNNWMLIMDIAVSVTNQWARLYFVSWYWIAAICLINLVIAQILEVVTKSLDKGTRNAAPGSGTNGANDGRGCSGRPLDSSSRHITAISPEMENILRAGTSNVQCVPAAAPAAMAVEDTNQPQTTPLSLSVPTHASSGGIGGSSLQTANVDYPRLRRRAVSDSAACTPQPTSQHLADQPLRWIPTGLDSSCCNETSERGEQMASSLSTDSECDGVPASVGSHGL